MTPIPEPGLGTSGHEGETCVESVIAALEAGYRHVDTAQMYENEREVGEGLARADVDREDVFLATKVHPSNLAGEDVIETTAESLERLGVEYVDLLYVHWPIDTYDPEETLPAFDEVRDRGWTRNVGVSNFTPDLLEEAIEILDAPVLANQVEVHPWLQQDELVSHSRSHDVTTVAYCPLAQGDVVDSDVLIEIGHRNDATPAQVTMAWFAGRDDVVAIPKATGDHIVENLDGHGIKLEAADVSLIEDLDDGRRLIDPDDAAWNR